MYKAVNKTIDLGDGRTINIETGKLAKFAKSVNFSWMLWWGSKTRPHPTKTEDGSGGTLPCVRQGVNG